MVKRRNRKHNFVLRDFKGIPKYHQWHRTLEGGENIMLDETKLDELIASAKSLQELGDAFVKATESLKEPGTPGAEGFTKAEAEAVVAKLDELKIAIQGMVTA